MEGRLSLLPEVQEGVVRYVQSKLALSARTRFTGCADGSGRAAPP